jgi:hypothetical protein
MSGSSEVLDGVCADAKGVDVYFSLPPLFKVANNAIVVTARYVNILYKTTTSSKVPVDTSATVVLKKRKVASLGRVNGKTSHGTAALSTYTVEHLSNVLYSVLGVPQDWKEMGK